MSERLGELLVKAGQLTRDQLREALAKQKEEGGRLGSNLVKMGLIQEPELVEFLSKHFKVSAINLSRVEIDESVVKIIPADVSRKYTIMPVSKAGAKVTIAMLDPTNVFAMDDIKFMTGYNVEPVIASETAIRDGDREILRLDPRPRAQEGDGGPRRRRHRLPRGAGRGARRVRHRRAG